MCFEELLAENFLSLARYKPINKRSLVKATQSNLKEICAKTHHNQTSEN